MVASNIYMPCVRELNVISNKNLAKLSLLLKGREKKKDKEDKSYIVFALKEKKKKKRQRR